jgi:hypothetical protein
MRSATLSDGGAGFARASATLAVAFRVRGESFRQTNPVNRKKGAHGGNLVSPMHEKGVRGGNTVSPAGN